MYGAPAAGAKAPKKTVRINVTARDSQIELIDGLAGMTRSSYVVQAAMLGVVRGAEISWGGG
jgi:hypothetical protein